MYVPTVTAYTACSVFREMYTFHGPVASYFICYLLFVIIIIIIIYICSLGGVSAL